MLNVNFDKKNATEFVYYSAFNRRIGDKWKAASSLEFHTKIQSMLEKDSENASSDRRSLMMVPAC